MYRTDFGDFGDLSALGTGLFVFVIILIIILSIIAIAFIVFAIIGRWKLFQKAGEEGWKSIIPVYSTLTLIKIAGLNWWWIFIAEASLIVSIIINRTFITNIANLATLLGSIAICYNLKEKFHKEQSWFILSVFFSGITIPLLGYSKKDTYDAAAPVNENAFFGGNQK